jgi:erythrin-vacuolar iron transport family protein
MTAITDTETAPAATDSQSFLLKRVQPALSGLMDGSLSTLAPIFAVVLALHLTRRRPDRTSDRL